MKREFAFALVVIGCLSAPAAAQYMPGTQERIGHWATRTYWPGDRHHWPGYGYGGRGYGVQPPVRYSEPVVTFNRRPGGVGYRAVYKPPRRSNGRSAERIGRSPARSDAKTTK